jgi:Mn-dependent DtxR family transcriptional regulator
MSTPALAGLIASFAFSRWLGVSLRGSDSAMQTAKNNMLDELSGHQTRSTLASEAQLADSLNVSRTTVRKALSELDRRKLVSREGKRTLLLRKPTRADYFPLVDTVATSDHVEKKFLEWMLRSDHKPDQQVNGLELAREFGVSTSAVREHLNRFSRFGWSRSAQIRGGSSEALQSSLRSNCSRCGSCLKSAQQNPSPSNCQMRPLGRRFGGPRPSITNCWLILSRGFMTFRLSMSGSNAS